MISEHQDEQGLFGTVRNYANSELRIPSSEFRVEPMVGLPGAEVE